MVLEHLELGDFKAEYALLTGNPKRVEQLAKQFHEPVLVTDRRGLDTWHAKFSADDPRELFIVGTGIGSPSLAIVFEELAVSGVHSFIRVGTCGPLQDHVDVGDIAVPTGVVRDEGTTLAFIREGYPAVANHELLYALMQVKENVDHPIHIGVTHAKDSFYTQKPEFNLDQDAVRKHWKNMRNAGVLVTEMESSALYVLASLRRCRAMSVLVVASMDRKNPKTAHGLDVAAGVARDVFKLAAPYKVPSDYHVPRVDESLLDDLKEGKF